MLALVSDLLFVGALAVLRHLAFDPASRSRLRGIFLITTARCRPQAYGVAG
jgi:hypothetical protein